MAQMEGQSTTFPDYGPRSSSYGVTSPCIDDVYSTDGDHDTFHRDNFWSMEPRVFRLSELQLRHEGLRNFLRNDVAADKTTQDFKELKEMFEQLESFLNQKHELLEASIEASSHRVSAQARWWTNANILDPKISDTVIDPMLERSPPADDPMDYGAYIRKSMYLVKWPRKDLVRWQRRQVNPKFEDFLERVYEEIGRIKCMPGGEWIAFGLYFDLKCDILPSPRGIEESSSWLFQEHEHIDRLLRAIDRLQVQSVRQTRPYDMVQAYRRLRERMANQPCPDLQNMQHNCCMHNLLLPALDFFQRRAYPQIYPRVLGAVGRRLPPEMVDHVFQCTLAAEGITVDPRILVPVNQGGSSNGQKKCVFPCRHEAGDTDRVGYERQFVAPWCIERTERAAQRSQLPAIDTMSMDIEPLGGFAPYGWEHEH